ncbi:hypothetical protein PVIIG_05263 [Plasmodium vivax India VII]|uniref:Variable surface protein n=1 Tax=Plasmodium vivax India VII TaxID=1077284 RepID=A0A0J9VA73_PLAVI|nr:hypothetical protein PVIIG_05263 [Plasmodium vivax India VII]
MIAWIGIVNNTFYLYIFLFFYIIDIFKINILIKINYNKHEHYLINYYFTYEDYCRFKNIFESLDEKSVDENIINTFILNKIKEDYERKRFIADCKKLQIYLKHLKTEVLCNDTKCCQYINYFLNDKISNNVIYKDKDKTFQLFQNYIRHDNKINTNMCVNIIQKIDDKIQVKIKELYKLYDLYEFIFQYGETNNMNQSFCDYLKEFVTEFNKVVEKHHPSNSSYLFYELKNLKCLIENNKWVSHKSCTLDLEALWTTKNTEYYKKTCETKGKAMQLSEIESGSRQHQNARQGEEIENGLGQPQNARQGGGMENVQPKSNNLKPVMPISLVIIIGGTIPLFMYKVDENTYEDTIVILFFFFNKN